MTTHYFACSWWQFQWMFGFLSITLCKECSSLSAPKGLKKWQLCNWTVGIGVCNRRSTFWVVSSCRNSRQL